MKTHKATSAKRVLTECGLLIWPWRGLPYRTRWSPAITCKNCLRTRPR